MNVFVYEHFCASPLDPNSPPSLLVEGRSMLTSVLAELVAEPDVSTTTLFGPGHRKLPAYPRTMVLPTPADLRGGVVEWTNSADAVILIAPEMGGVAAEIAAWVEAAGGRLLGVNANAIALFSDKLQTYLTFPEFCIPTWHLTDSPQADRVVLKPRDGVGALFTVASTRSALSRALRRVKEGGFDVETVLQPHWPGTSASVAVLGRGPNPPVLLPAAEQRIRIERDGIESDVSWFHYEGGVLPLSGGLGRRARTLASAFAARLDPFHGYLGIDLILGAEPDGAFDRIVDVNPRITTSFVGYRRLFAGRMGSLLLGLETEETIQLLEADHRAHRFWSDGRVEAAQGK
jgi:predicted ATP-grasp superfamily ATP-dependent carboligase